MRSLSLSLKSLYIEPPFNEVEIRCISARWKKKLPDKVAKMTARHKNILTAKPYEKQTN